MTAERLLVLYHPAAGDGRTRARVERLLRGDATAARSARFLPVRTPHEAADALADAGPASPGIVVAAGGDGTVNLVATALLQQEGGGAPLAVLPLGTGNAFAAALGVGSLRAAVSALVRPELTRVDVMRTTHPEAPLALVSISGGFEARFIQRYGARRARWGRPAAALVAALAAQRGARAPRIVADGEALADGPAFNAGLYNMRCYGFGLTMWHDADHHDGTAEAVVCAARRHYCALLGRGLRTAARCDSADPRWTRWRRAVVDAVAPLQIDGELVPPGSFEVRVEPGALRVVVPDGYEARRSAVAAD